MPYSDLFVTEAACASIHEVAELNCERRFKVSKLLSIVILGLISAGIVFILLCVERSFSSEEKSFQVEQKLAVYQAEVQATNKSVTFLLMEVRDDVKQLRNYYSDPKNHLHEYKK